MLSRYLAPAAALLGLAVAQTSTSCNPLNTTDCPADPAFGTSYLFNFNQTPSFDLWETTAGTVNYDRTAGATFTINEQGDSPTIRTKFYFFFGRSEIWLKAASGIGIVSSMMWLSDDLDEVDWEFLGANGTYGETNYFGKGRQDFDNSISYPVTATADYHNYTTTWTSEQIEWWIDGNLVRTLTADAANSTQNYPQTPMRLSLGIWAGGDPSMPEGTREWAGGNTTYSDGPFNMYVSKVQISDYSTGSEYTYGDETGDWKSINITSGNSTAYEVLHKEPKKTSAEKWEALPQSTKTAVYAGGGSAAAVIVAALSYLFIRQRRKGVAEARLAEQKEQRDELMNYRNGEDVTTQGHEYSSGGWTKLT